MINLSSIQYKGHMNGVNAALSLFVYGFSSAMITIAKEPLTMIFAHGLADTYRQGYRWKKTDNPQRAYVHNGPVITYNFPDATEQFWRVNFPWTGLGQDNEIAALKEVVDAYQREHSNELIILGGVSRGAATVINYVALHKPKNIAALYLESPFSSMHDVAQHIVATSLLKYIPYAHEMSPYLVGCIFWRYSYNGIQPIDVIASIDPHIPLFFISKDDDYLVPGRFTEKLIEALKTAGRFHVYHVKLTQGKHGNLIIGPEGHKIQEAAHTFNHYCKLTCDNKTEKETENEIL